MSGVALRGDVEVAHAARVDGEARGAPAIVIAGGAADPAQADLLLVWSGATWFSFYYNTTNNRWQLVGDPASRDGYVIKAGTPVFVQRRGAGATAADKTVVFPAQGS